MKSLRQLKLAGLPRLVEPRLQRTVEAQQNIPAFAGYGLHPVGFVASWRCRSEINVYGGIGIDDDGFIFTADARKLLVGLQHRTSLVVVNDERPEVFRRNVGRQMNLVRPAPV